jgi:pyruvate dehydrogenase E2 component (dihydrolipoamide acetyltransferase)
MAYVVRMPKLGMEMQEGVLLEWHVERGESVSEGDLLAEIESEKSTAEVTAREDGVVRRLLLEPGASVEPGTPMGVVATADEPIEGLVDGGGGDADRSGRGRSPDAPASAGEPDSPAGDEASSTDPARDPAGGQPEKVSPRARRRAEELGVALAGLDGSGLTGSVVEADVERAASAGSAAGTGSATEPATAGASEDAGTVPETAPDPRSASVKATPKARRRARDLGVELAGIDGTGPEGAVRAADVEAVADASGRAPRRVDAGESTAGTGAATDGHDRTVATERPLSGMRRTIADRLGESYREAAHVTVSRELDVEALLEAKTVADDALDVDVSIADLLLLGVSGTLADHPAFNATFEDDVHRLYDDQHVGLAVDVEAGLVTPVLHGLESRSLPALARERRRLVDLALDGDYEMDDLAGGTFTVTNLGVLGVDSFTPIINPPQVAILGVGSLREVPVRGPDDGVEWRRRIGVDLSFDHRVVDGADAARFLETLGEHLRDPWPLLLERA